MKFNRTLIALIVLTIIVTGIMTFTQKVCPDCKGGKCGCDWANEKSCKKDDGSCCWSCCCGPFVNGKKEITASPQAQESHETYCPSETDLVVAYGKPTIINQGWSLIGGGGVATKAAFNLLGGSVEYDFDTSKTNAGVNTNIYTISPAGIESTTGFVKTKNYCDGAEKRTEADWCVEVDWLESNGSCGGQTALHTIPGKGNHGCTAWGCHARYQYNGKQSFHMKITYEADGEWKTYRDGQLIAASSFSPAPSKSDWGILAKQYKERGAVIYSSQWVGWVPLEKECGEKGDLSTSSYSVKNLKIVGSVVQGPKPTKCKGKRRMK